MIILFGPAGSGKGTQGQALAQLYGWRWLSNGEVIRQSHRYDDTIRRGELIPDNDVIEMMNTEIQKAHAAGQDVILDGYPRDEAQARYLLQHFTDKIDGAIVLDVPKDELYQRLALRGREDDQDRAAIDQRFAIFEQNIYSISHLFAEHHIPVIHVDGLGTPEEVTARVKRVVQKFLSKKGPTHD